MNPQIEKAINNQINLEFSASYLYLGMALYMDAEHLPGFAAWMVAQSDDERNHGRRLLRYMLDRNGNVELESIAKPEVEFSSVKAVFEASLERSINELYALASELDDYATQVHLQWFLDEQVEEEKSISDILGRLEIVGDDKMAILIIDQALAGRLGDIPDAISIGEK